MNFTNWDLPRWLSWAESLNQHSIDLGLSRIHEVAERMGLLKPSCPIITVAGTNGKGSCVAFSEAVYLAAGYRVGTFNSPVLFKHNEYVRIQGKNADDELFCQAFQRVEQARNNVPLTFFEFNTLAAFDIFQKANLDVWILEVGLGGRLDAVNVIDADVAIITTIAMDHMQWLGNTRELIAREKAGIFRTGHPAVCGDFDPPASLTIEAKQKSTPLYCQNKDFSFEKNATTWNFKTEKIRYEDLHLPALALQNMASILMAVTLLQEKLPVSRQAIDQALVNVNLPGRIQVVATQPMIILDVSHNPAAAEFLAKQLLEKPCTGKTHAIFSMLSDKDILGTILAMKSQVHHWHIAELSIARGASLAMLKKAFQEAEITNVSVYSSIAEACQTTLNQIDENDRVIIFGSFHVVSIACKTLNARACAST